MNTIKIHIALIAIIFSICSTTFAQSVFQNINVLELGPNNVLFAGESRSGKIYAFQMDNTAKFSDHLYNISDIDDKIAQHLATTSENIMIKDMLVHPQTKQAYVAVSRIVAKRYQSIIVIVSPNGKIETFDMKKNLKDSFTLEDSRNEKFNFLNGQSSENLNITDLDYHNGELFISGLSNGTFASTLRVLSYPFSKQRSTSIEMFHTVHGQKETRAPIRTLEIITLNGEEYILAAYTCTPLVLIPLKELRNGTHVIGKTIAELGFGNTPIDFVHFTAMDMSRKPFDAILLTNKNRNAQLISISEIEKSNQNEGFQKAVGFDPAGTPFTEVPITQVLHIDNLDQNHLLTLRRNADTGKLELFSVMKNLYLRLSDFQSEFESPGYEYAPGQEKNKERHNRMKREEGYPGAVKE